MRLRTVARRRVALFGLVLVCVVVGDGRCTAIASSVGVMQAAGAQGEPADHRVR